MHWALQSSAPKGVDVFQTAAVALDKTEKLYIPDVVAAPRSSLSMDGSIAPQDVLITVEITSPGNTNVDRQEKLRAYAAGGVPAYLLIDIVRSSGATATLYTDPVGGEYQHVVQVPFGETLRLPKPFDADLDTSLFRMDA